MKWSWLWRTRAETEVEQQRRALQAARNDVVARMAALPPSSPEHIMLADHLHAIDRNLTA